MGIVEDIIVIICCGVLSGLIFYKLRLPLFLGYILVGIIIGPYTGGFTVSNPHDVAMLAEIGVALLLFSVGLDLTLDELKEVRWIAFLGTPLQVFITSILGFFIGKYAGFDDTSSMVLGVAVSSSSTMVILKILSSRGLGGTLSGKVMVSVSVMQDIVVIPMMIIVLGTQTNQGGIESLAIVLLKGVIFITVIIFAGNKFLPWVFSRLARIDSREVFLLAAVSAGLGVGYISWRIGLSFAFGAFIAGLVLGRSAYSHQTLAGIVPLRDIFGLLFFVSIGMLVDPASIKSEFAIIIQIVVAVILGKFIIVAILCRIMGYVNIMPLAVGLGLAQISEFAFVIATISKNSGIIDERMYSIIIPSTVITMLASPFLTLLASPIYSLFKRIKPRQTYLISNNDKNEAQDVILIIGGGSIGGSVAAILNDINIPFVVVEQNYLEYEKNRRLGYTVLFGDGTVADVLRAAGLEKARLVMITVPVISICKNIIEEVRKIVPEMHIIARAAKVEQMLYLDKLGVYETVQPEFEAGIEFMRQALAHCEIPLTIIQKYAEDVRYQQLLMLHGGIPEKRKQVFMRNPQLLFDLQWIHVEGDNPLAGQTITGLDIRRRTGASVVGVYRNLRFLPNPQPGFVFMPGDIVAIIADEKSRKKFEKIIINNS